MTEPYYRTEHTTIFHGDCIDVMADLADESVHAVVTDPPYGLEFMGKAWDSPWKGGGDVQTAVIEGTPVSHPFRDGSNRVRYGTSDMRGFQDWCERWATECFRVLKPGGHILASGGSRTWHRLAAGIEDAGFEIRDSIAWIYGTGFPKSLDVSKAIDKLDATDERRDRARRFQAWLSPHMTAQQVNALTGTDMGHHLTTHPTQPAVATSDVFDLLRPSLPPVPAEIEALVAERTVESKNFAARQVTGTRSMVDPQQSRLGFAGQSHGGTSATRDVDETIAHTEAARTWEGWGTALKPAFEPIVVGRKPLGYGVTVAASVLQHGTGALNIDASRIGTEDMPKTRSNGVVVTKNSSMSGGNTGRVDDGSAVGRWPSNVILDDEQAGEVDRQSGVSTNGASNIKRASGSNAGGNRGPAFGAESRPAGSPMIAYGDTGGASRYFPTFRYEAKAPGSERPNVDGTMHATVKPLALMQWLVRLVTPPGGIVLEPFAVSGTTVEACLREGFTCWAIEREAEYLPLIMKRVRKDHPQSLFGDDFEDESA